MNLQFYLEKMQSFDAFKKFKKENPKAYFCSGFFIIDKEGKNNQSHLDFFVPEENKIISFDIASNILQMPVQPFNGKIPEKISKTLNFDFDKIENLIIEKMEKENIKNKIQKIILSLQNVGGEIFLIGTIFVLVVIRN